MKEGKIQRSHGTPTSGLVNATKIILRPLIGMLLDNGLSYPWFNKVAKSIYVDVAEKEFGLPDKKVTDSRISLITGLYRREVKRLRIEVDESYTLSDTAHLGSRLMAIWCSDTNFMDQQNNPAPLARTPTVAAARNIPCFEDLVSEVTTNIRPRSILDEWLRVGVVSVNEHDEVCVEPRAFIPSKSTEERLFYLSRNVSDHLSAGRINISSDNPPFVERSVFYDELTEDSVEELARFAERKAMDALTSVNRKAHELQKRDHKHRNNNHHMNFGTYYFSESTDPKENFGGSDSVPKNE